MQGVNRRRFLKAGVAVGVIALTGCSDGSGGDNDEATRPPSQWENTYGNDDFDTKLFGVTPTRDGGYLATGFQGSPETIADGLLLKVDQEGEQEWLETYAGPRWDWLTLPLETDNGYVAIGTETTEAYSPGEEALLLAVEEDGDVEWERTFSEEVSTRGWGIARTEDGGYLLSARTIHGSPWRATRPLVVKTDAEGDEDWRGTFLPDDAPAGKLDSILATDDGYLLTGSISTESSDTPRGYAIEIDASGNELWSNRYREGNFGPAVPIDDGYLICGQAFDPKERHGWVVKIGGDGVERWSQIYSGGAEGFISDLIPAADAMGSGGSYLAVGFSKPGTSEDQVGWLLAIDDDGTKRGESTWDEVGSSGVLEVEMADNGAYVLAGWTDRDGSKSEDNMAMGRLVVTTEFDFGS